MRRDRPLPGDLDAVQPQRVEIVIGVRTLMTLFVFGLLVALAILSLGTLLSIFLAAVLALGLDPIVGALVKRGWKRGRAALVVFAGLFASVFALVIVIAGPVWDQIVEFVNELPAMWENLQQEDWFQSVTSDRRRRRQGRRGAQGPGRRACRRRRRRCSASRAASSARCSRSSR